jgi:hypothetical protein
MGLSPFHASSCSCFHGAVREVIREVPVPNPDPRRFIREVSVPNPDPRRFVITRVQAAGSFTVVEAHYEGVTNYEGRKIMVCAYPEKVIRSRHVLDPHFCDSVHHVSPFARFEPTKEGWAAAVDLALTMNSRLGEPNAERRSSWERLMETER